MIKIWNGVKLCWLNAGFYGGLVFITVAGIFFVSVPLFCWVRYARGVSTGVAMRHLIWLYGRAWTRLLSFFVPLRLENCRAPLPKPCIFVPNHQSFFDAYCFGFLPKRDIAFAVRAWPFKMPFYGPYMRLAEYMNTEGRPAGEILKEAKALLEKGASIVIFAEGTRSLTGNLQRFHAGAFRLSHATGVPIVPVCFDGTGAFLRKGSFILRPSVIAVKVLDPVRPEEFAAYGDEAPLVLRRTVKERLGQALSELRCGKQPAPQPDYGKEYV